MLERLFGFVAAFVIATSVALAEGKKAKPISPDHSWHFSGLTGQHEIAQVQRGFQVFWAKCAACHGLEFRRFWHLEKIGYTEPEVKSLLIDYLAGAGETYDSSVYSIQNFPASRVAGAPDLSHGVLANGKTMEQGADYIYSLLLGYDRVNNAVLGRATQRELNPDDSAYTAVGEPTIIRDAAGKITSITTKYAKNNFYLYGEGKTWVLHNYLDLRTDLQEFDGEGNALPLESSFSYRLDEADAQGEAAYAATHEGYSAPTDASQAWAKRHELHTHEVASWAAGQAYNPFKAGGVLSMATPLAALENFHRTDFTVEELAQDPSELENASYWLLTNQDLQPQILDLIPSLQDAYARIPAGETAATYRPFYTAAEPVRNLLDQLQPETKPALAQDVVAFLAWSSDINLSARKQTGLFVVLLLAILSILLYFFYREVAKIEFAKQAQQGGPWDDNH